MYNGMPGSSQNVMLTRDNYGVSKWILVDDTDGSPVGSKQFDTQIEAEEYGDSLTATTRSLKLRAVQR